jgi:hypothetical protein
MRRIALIAATLLPTLGIFLVGGGPAKASGAPPYGLDKWALIIGIDHFQGKTRPNVGADGDARAFHDALVQRGWPDSHIGVLTDGNATQAGIRNGFKWLAAATAQDHGNSFAVVHYSGHVKQTGGHEYLWPSDNNFISDTEFVQAMQQVPGWLWADISGCESQGFDDGLAGPQRLVTTSSRVNEKSYENPSWKQSIFSGLEITQAMLQNEGDYNHDGHITVQEAFVYAAQRAPGMTQGQDYGPQHPYLAGGDGTEWFLDPPAPAPPPQSPPPKDPGGPQSKPPLLPCNSKVCIRS